jgi:hypothetical protein
MPLVNLLLQVVALCQQRAILGAQVSDDIAQRFPKAVCLNAGARRDLIAH